ncbi:hypothetical protein B0H17DRAFT_716510 [Mycena rosella]|uniref:Uncharacterized protein n=1 Tax=Mycena rosella TaxID=1033263 RepID=A0AAD7D9H3_MYCRO|nr:hypothetical protein B0H17DRAFT_716510 [Mycena rosella]
MAKVPLSRPVSRMHIERDGRTRRREPGKCSGERGAWRNEAPREDGAYPETGSPRARTSTPSTGDRERRLRALCDARVSYSAPPCSAPACTSSARRQMSGRERTQLYLHAAQKRLVLVKGARQRRPGCTGEWIGREKGESIYVGGGSEWGE